MAQRLSEQVVEWLTVGGDAFTPQNFNSTNGNIPLVISKPGESVTIPATNGTAIGIYNNKGQLWTLGAVAASTSVKSSQLIVSSSDSGNGSGVGIELWRGAYTSWQLLGSNGTDGIFYIGNNSATTNKATYDSNIALGYGAPANQYVHIYSTLDSNYAHSVGGAALSVMGGITAAKKIYFADTTDSNYATKAGALVVEGGANIAKKVYLRDTTDSSYATVAGSFVTMGGVYIKKKTYIADVTDSNYATKAGSFVTEGGAYIAKKTYIASTTDSNYSTKAGSLVTEGGIYSAKKVYIADATDSNYSTLAGALVVAGGANFGKKVYLKDTTDSTSYTTGSFSTAGGASIAKKLYVGSSFYQTGDTAQIASNNIVFRNKSVNNSQAGSYPYITGLTIGDGSETTLDEYKDGYLSIHSKSGLLIYPTNSTRPAVYDATKTYSVGTIVWYSNDYYRCTTAITEAQEWTAVNWTKLPVAAGAMWVHGNVNPTITNTYTLGTASYRWSKLYVGTADSYGSGVKPIYWNAGVPTVSSSTVGSGVKPIYLSSGEIKVSSSTVGSGIKPVYLNSGEITVSSSTAGSSTMPVYLNSGTLTQITSYSGDISVTNTTPTSATTYYMVYVDGTSGARTLRVNPHLYYYDNAPAGSSWLNIGNSSEVGGLTLWSNGYHVDLRAVSSLSAVRTIQFPNVAGTVVLGSGTANHITYFNGANTVAAAPNITHGDYSLTITDPGAQSPTFKLTGSSTSFGLLIGSSNTNRGIYDYTGSKWLLHWDNSDTGRLNSTLIPNANNTYSLGSSSAFWSNLYVNNIYLQRGTNAAYGRIGFYSPSYKTWTVYMSNNGSGTCPSGGTPSTLGDVTGWALRSYIENASGYGWIWESAAESNTGTPTARMSLSSNNGTLQVAGLIKSTLNSNTVTIGSQNSGFCHIYNSANIPFIFNNSICTTKGAIIGQTGQYRPYQLYLGYNTTSDSSALDSANPLIEFASSGRSQYAQIVYTDFNNQGGSDSINFVSNQSDLRVKGPIFQASKCFVTANHGTSNPGSSTPGNGITGAVYFKRI